MTARSVSAVISPTTRPPAYSHRLSHWYLSCGWMALPAVSSVATSGLRCPTRASAPSALSVWRAGIRLLLGG
ncbi:hypothetical protein BS50DRAFT_240545 [Corynespora cassiicola Philippines]|uniref:Uncharacterized protein n=1 Tax=Corynespora cassiicola Philippines TaxID=1448308 RepID=A0A2T2P2R9_CORCC|nr:hypothetical protein BS50DRAFT_240545 [Corynespora cassiicola Philippines]